MNATNFPPPNATRQEIELWKSQQPKPVKRDCVCGHSETLHPRTLKGACRKTGCKCMGFAPKVTT